MPHEYLSDHPAYRAEEDVDYLNDDDLPVQFDKLRISDAAASSSATGDQSRPKKAEERKGKAGKEGKGKGKASKKGADEEVGAEWTDWDSAINLWKRWDLHFRSGSTEITTQSCQCFGMRNQTTLTGYSWEGIQYIWSASNYLQ